jgi:hypothetical protein
VLEALGDGSDCTAFQDFAGISTVDLSCGDEEDGAQVARVIEAAAAGIEQAAADFERALAGMH